MKTKEPNNPETELKLTPWDDEIIVMCENLLQKKVEVRPTAEGYAIVAPIPETESQTRHAIIEAVKGKAGDRWIECGTESERMFLQIRKDSTEFPRLIRTDFDTPRPEIGKCYRRKSLNITAIQIREDNLSDVLQFVGGGSLKSLHPESPAIFTFIDEKGLTQSAPEGWWVIHSASTGRFNVLADVSFKELFEDSESHPDTLTPIADDLTELYGKDIQARIKKAAEELGELKDAADKYYSSHPDERSVEDMLDELADLNIVIFQIAALLGTTQQDLVLQAYDKISKRKTDPNYKRKHTHIENDVQRDSVRPEDKPQAFMNEIEGLINRYSLEGHFHDTPDFILARIAWEAMEMFGRATQQRDIFHNFAGRQETEKK